ncbi:MAG: ABC transporter permease subunit [Pirellulales bacterium]|nr:ABC transporter permease subunit [Pirellulales bacterium]
MRRLARVVFEHAAGAGAVAVWSYILRRLLLMVPTLFGVTIVSFVIMQLAPGDPELAQLGAGGLAGQSTQTREAYLIQKRDLRLDLPLVFNFRYFRDYAEPIAIAAHFLGRTHEEIVAELPDLARRAEDPDAARVLAFLRKQKIADLQERLKKPALHDRLARAIFIAVRNYCEDLGKHGVPAAMAMLRSDRAGRKEKIGAIRCLNHMVVDPFVYTYSRDPSEAETPQVLNTWRTWWQRNEDKVPQLDQDQRKTLDERFEALVALPSRSQQFEELEYFDRSQMRYFAERLFDEDSTLDERVVASWALRLHVGKPLQLDVPHNASPELVRQTAENWFAYYEPRQDEFQPGFFKKAWYTITDTQYAHMLVRLATFNFGRSAVRTREPVSRKIWDAVIVSAPLMVLAELVIYLVAVPLGILCAVHRGQWIDRSISLGLFLLYSIPAYVAGMLFLLFLAYGDYLRWFPMMGLHSEGADQMGLVAYFLDYLHHAFLPVVCLSLFALAGIAMYSRTSMLDVMGQDFIRTARAKGVSERQVIYKHGMRNALIPILTLFSNFLPAMLGGSVLVEVIFNIPGMGRLSWESIEQKDFPTLMALIYIDAIVVMFSILLTDLLYVLVDPRISFQGRGKTA